MTTIVVLVWLTLRATFAAECPNLVTCPCGNKGGNVRVCVPADADEVCTRLSKCESCEDGLDFCSKCPQGLEGPFCSREIRKYRPKRQATQPPEYGSLAAEDYEGFECEHPGLVLNGKTWYLAPGAREWSPDKEMDEYPSGSVLKYICDKSFRLRGSENLTCDSNGFWSAERPLCVGDCGQAFVHTDVRNRDDNEPMFGEWPWVVSISVQRENHRPPVYICGGALVNTRSVVTAAHCLEEGRTYILRFGKHHFRIEDDDPDVLIRTSSRVILHPDYSPVTLDSDIALIVFEPDLDYSVRVQPICLPTLETTLRNIQTRKMGYVINWGDTEMELSPDTLTVARMPVLSLRDCIDYFRKVNVTVSLTGNMFCAVNVNLTHPICSGSSGSPFVFYDYLTKRYTVEGLVSFSRRNQLCSSSGKSVVLTQVFRFIPWIYQNME